MQVYEVIEGYWRVYVAIHGYTRIYEATKDILGCMIQQMDIEAYTWKQKGVQWYERH